MIARIEKLVLSIPETLGCLCVSHGRPKSFIALHVFRGCVAILGPRPEPR